MLKFVLQIENVSNFLLINKWAPQAKFKPIFNYFHPPQGGDSPITPLNRGLGGAPSFSRPNSYVHNLHDLTPSLIFCRAHEHTEALAQFTPVSDFQSVSNVAR